MKSLLAAFLGFINSASIAYSLPSEQQPYISYHKKIFRQDVLRILYLELDPGVDDGAALLQLLAARRRNAKEGKSIIIEGIIPCVGNVVLKQAIKNTQQFLELT